MILFAFSFCVLVWISWQNSGNKVSYTPLKEIWENRNWVDPCYFIWSAGK